MSSASSPEGLSKVGGPIDRISLSEILVDFFGSLVPGLIFVIAFLVLFGLTLVAWLNVIGRYLQAGSSFDANRALQFLGNLLSPYWLGVLLFILMFAFVAGHFFFRQDPKKPDAASFLRISSKMKPEDLENWVVIEKDDYCEFPYPNLYGYLRSRGLKHLAQLVTWRKDDFNKGQPSRNIPDEVRRTKNFINILKIRLAFHFPEKLGAIARNEAHIRLMSSTWYMARELRNLSVGTFLISLFPLTWAMYHHYEVRVIAYVLPVIVPLMVLLISMRAQRIIEKFLHYQRVREIVFALETSYTAFRNRPELLRDICPDFAD